MHYLTQLFQGLGRDACQTLAEIALKAGVPSDPFTQGVEDIGLCAALIVEGRSMTASTVLGPRVMVPLSIWIDIKGGGPWSELSHVSDTPSSLSIRFHHTIGQMYKFMQQYGLMKTSS